MSKKSERAAEVTDAIKGLRKMGVKPGKKIYATVNHVSSSGMTRRISFFIVAPYTRTGADGKKHTTHEVMNITGYVAHALGYPRHREGGLIVQGCGMDMGFHVVYNLGRTMFPKGGSLEHSPRAYQERAVGRETDGGYLLKHEWL